MKGKMPFSQAVAASKQVAHIKTLKLKYVDMTKASSKRERETSVSFLFRRMRSLLILYRITMRFLILSVGWAP